MSVKPKQVFVVHTPFGFDYVEANRVDILPCGTLQFVFERFRERIICCAFATGSWRSFHFSHYPSELDVQPKAKDPERVARLVRSKSEIEGTQSSHQS
ncbi:MAG: hypothetical protein AB1647_03885 [Pseudomonadota bacterium]